MNSHKVTKHACTHTITLKQWTNNKTNKSYKQLIYIHISCKCDKNRAGHFTLDAHASRPVACCIIMCVLNCVCYKHEAFKYRSGIDGTRSANPRSEHITILACRRGLETTKHIIG